MGEPGSDLPDAPADAGELGTQGGDAGGFPVVLAEEAEDQRPAGGPPHQFHGDLDRLGAGIRKKRLGKIPRSDL